MTNVTINMPRAAAALLFGQACEAVSERCWCAGWMSGLEDALPKLCLTAATVNVAQRWGQGDVTPDEARALLALADSLGGWGPAFNAYVNT